MGDVDRRKHDVDVIERVLGSLRDNVAPPEESKRLLDVEVPWLGGTAHSTVEMTVGFCPESLPSPNDRRRR